MATKSAPGKVGRPKATVQLKSITVNLDPTLISAIERARVRREKAVPGVSVNLTDAVRALLMKAIASEEQAEPQAELPLPLESSTRGRHQRRWLLVTGQLNRADREPEGVVQMLTQALKLVGASAEPMHEDDGATVPDEGERNASQGLLRDTGRRRTAAVDGGDAKRCTC